MLCRQPEPPAGFHLLLKRCFCKQRVASGQGRQRLLQGWPFTWIGTCGTVQQALQRLLFPLAPHSTRYFRAPRRREALLSASHQRHPFFQLRVHSQPRCVSDGIDQAAHVVIPAAFAECHHIPIAKQRPQALRQLSSGDLSQLGVLHQQGDHCEQLLIAAGQGRLQLMAHHVVGILQAGQVGGVSPATADDGHAGLAGRQGLLNLLPPLARADAGHISKQPFPAKTDPQPIPYPPAGSSGIITAVADEDAAALSCKTRAHDSWQPLFAY